MRKGSETKESSLPGKSNTCLLFGFTLLAKKWLSQNNAGEDSFKVGLRRFETQLTNKEKSNYEDSDEDS